jgi:hypothetical protein
MQPSSHAAEPQAAAQAPIAPPAAAGIGMPVLLRAMAFGIGTVAVVVAIAWLTGLLPEGTVDFVALGAGAALAAGVLALWIHGRFLDARAAAPIARDGRLMAGRLQGLLAAAFAVKLAVLVIGMLYLSQFGVKFAGKASFCIAFAGASLVCQLATAGYLARALQRRRTDSSGLVTFGPVGAVAKPAANEPRR